MVYLSVITRKTKIVIGNIQQSNGWGIIIIHTSNTFRELDK